MDLDHLKFVTICYLGFINQFFSISPFPINTFVIYNVYSGYTDTKCPKKPHTDYIGGDMGMEEINSEGECIQRCLQFDSCVAVTFLKTDSGSGQCYKKRGGWEREASDQRDIVSINVQCIRDEIRELV